MSFTRTAFTLASAIAAIVAVAKAETIDQEQPLINASAGYHGVGGDSEQKLAQTFKVGMTGRLIALDLPIACAGGDLIVEIRRQDGGKPTGAVLRTIRASLSSLGPVSFRRLYLPTRLVVSSGDELAFTVEVEDEGNCNYATAPDGDTYPRGEGFFDSRPNPPGWVAMNDFINEPHDLPFKTVMEDAADRRAGRCVAFGITDPDTGEWLELPISRDTPACRCFEDQSAREFRCGVLHPDFYMVRRIPWPLVAGKKFTEKWEFTPLTDLDGPVRMTLKGGGLYKPVYRDFGFKSEPGQTETFEVDGIAPKAGEEVQGIAAFEYDMQDASNEHLKQFGLDTSIGPYNYK